MTSRLRIASLAALAYGGIFVMSAADAPRDRGATVAARRRDRPSAWSRRWPATMPPVRSRRPKCAVQVAPTEAGYRLLLGQSYLQAGRFASAAQAFADTLTLDGSNGPVVGKAALNLALTQIAGGDWQTARRTLGGAYRGHSRRRSRAGAGAGRRYRRGGRVADRRSRDRPTRRRSRGRIWRWPMRWRVSGGRRAWSRRRTCRRPMSTHGWSNGQPSRSHTRRPIRSPRCWASAGGRPPANRPGWRSTRRPRRSRWRRSTPAPRVAGSGRGREAGRDRSRRYPHRVFAGAT